MLGGFTLSSVMAFHINSMGTSDSDQGMVNSGESQRTIDDGSSYRAMRLSSLSPSMRSSTRTPLRLNLRLGTIPATICPFEFHALALIWSGAAVIHTLLHPPF